MTEGGGRKGLPQSFLSRFSRVFFTEMTDSDMLYIAESNFSQHLEKYSISENFSIILLSILPNVVLYVRKLQEDVDNGYYGRDGGAPWEFNLRDVLRCLNLVQMLAGVPNWLSNAAESTLMDTARYVVSEAIFSVLIVRFRSQKDRLAAIETFCNVFRFKLIVNQNPTFHSTVDMESGDEIVHVGLAKIVKTKTNEYPQISSNESCRMRAPLVGGLLKSMEVVMHCVVLHWPCLLIGESGVGKRTLIRHLAEMTSSHLIEYATSPSTDTTDLLGAFEQVQSFAILLFYVNHFIA
jgi:midasin